MKPAQPVQWDLKVLKAFKDLKDLKVLPANKDLKDLKVQLVTVFNSRAPLPM